LFRINVRQRPNCVRRERRREKATTFSLLSKAINSPHCRIFTRYVTRSTRFQPLCLYICRIRQRRPMPFHRRNVSSEKVTESTESRSFISKMSFSEFQTNKQVIFELAMLVFTKRMDDSRIPRIDLRKKLIHVNDRQTRDFRNALPFRRTNVNSFFPEI